MIVCDICKQGNHAMTTLNGPIEDRSTSPEYTVTACRKCMDAILVLKGCFDIKVDLHTIVNEASKARGQ